MVAVDPLLQSQGSVAQVEENIMGILREMQTGDRFMLMSPLKPDIPKDNIIIIRNLMDQYGIFPIKV